MVSCGFANICGGVLNSAQCEQPVFLQAGVPAPPYLCRFRPVGKGLERETLLPFPRLRGSGTHYETGPGFLLLFSIKSKEEHPCFAEKVPNGRTTNLVQEIFCANALNQCEALLFFARLRPIGACAAAFSYPREVIPLRPSKKELFSSFFVNSLKTVFPHPPWFLQYNPRHAP